MISNMPRASSQLGLIKMNAIERLQMNNRQRRVLRGTAPNATTRISVRAMGLTRSRTLGALIGVIGLGSGMFGSLAAASTPTSHTTSRVGGSVNVLYASSLQNIFERSIGPRFRRATGYTFVGYSGASGVLANEEKAGVIRGDVYVSAASAVNGTLEGPANGDFVNWFVVFANSPLVIGYNPHSAFAAALRTRPWYEVIARPGFRVGRTDPAVDPKGKLTVSAVNAAEARYNSRAVGSVIASASDVYPEQTLVGLLQSGQLDAGFFYRSEARAAGIPFVTLGQIHLDATYTVALLAKGPNRQAGESFVHFLLGATGRDLLARAGLSVVRPRLFGSRSLVPASIQSELSG